MTKPGVFEALEGNWTSLGMPIPKSVKSAGAIARLVGADFKVEKRPCYYKAKNGKLIEATNRNVIVRADNDHMLSIASVNRYNLDFCQPKDLISAIDEELRAERLEPSHIAVFHNGADIVISCVLPDEYDIHLAKKDTIKRYLSLIKGYNGRALSCLIGDVRIFCQNTIQWATAEAKRGGTIKSIKASTLMTADSIKTMMEQVRILAAPKGEEYKLMAKTKMSDTDVDQFFSNVLKLEHKKLDLVSTKMKTILEKLSNAYESAPGADVGRGTVWGALNAVTYYATHQKYVRDTGREGANQARLASNLYGDAANLKLRALELAQQFVGVAA